MTAIIPVVVSNMLFAAALALVTAAVTRFWRSPQLAHGLWALVLIKLITPPVAMVTIPFSSNWFGVVSRQVESVLNVGDEAQKQPPVNKIVSRRSTVGNLPSEPTTGESPTAKLPPADTWAPFKAVFGSHWESIVALVWFVGGFVYTSFLFRRCLLFKYVLTIACNPPAEISSAASRLASKMGLSRCPSVRVVAAPIPPLVWSLGIRPVVLLPRDLLDELDTPQRDAVIAHELAHVRRRDDLVRWLEIVTLVVFWWNPIAWYARRKLREAEEECCDAWVVWMLPNERVAYGEAMLKAVEFLTDRPMLPVFAGSAFGSSSYKRRIEMIMKGNVNRKMHWAAFALVVMLGAAALPVAARTGLDDNGEYSYYQPYSFYQEPYSFYRPYAFYGETDDERDQRQQSEVKGKYQFHRKDAQLMQEQTAESTTEALSRKQSRTQEPKTNVESVSASAQVVCVLERSLIPNATVREAWLRVSGDEPISGEFRPGHEVVVRLHAVPNEAYRGRIIKAVPAVVSLIDPPKFVKAGLTANVDINTRSTVKRRNVDAAGAVAHMYEEFISPDAAIRQGWIRLKAEASFTSDLRAGDSAVIHLDALPDETFLGQVVSADPAILSFCDPPNHVKLGLTAVARIETTEESTQQQLK